jgi:hypothetical protein
VACRIHTSAAVKRGELSSGGGHRSSFILMDPRKSSRQSPNRADNASTEMFLGLKIAVQNFAASVTGTRPNLQTATFASKFFIRSRII